MICQRCYKEYELDYFGMNQALCDECEDQQWREGNVKDSQHGTLVELLRSARIDSDGIKEFEEYSYAQLLQWCCDLYEAGELMYDELLEIGEIDGIEEPSEGMLAWEEARKLKDIRDTEAKTQEEQV